MLGKMSANELWQKYKSTLHLQLEITDYNDYFFSHSQPILPGQQLLCRLASQYPLGLLTNTVSGSFSYMKKYHLLPNFHYKIILESSKIGLVKPDPAFFLLAQKQT